MNLLKRIAGDIKKSLNETEEERMKRKKEELAKLKADRKRIEEKNNLEKELAEEKAKLREQKWGY